MQTDVRYEYVAVGLTHIAFMHDDKGKPAVLRQSAMVRCRPARRSELDQALYGDEAAVDLLAIKHGRCKTNKYRTTISGWGNDDD